MNKSSSTMPPAYVAESLRHYADLRDLLHGDASSRPDKEQLFIQAATLLDPHARQVLEELDTHLLLGTGEIRADGVQRSADGSVISVWELFWPQQRSAGIGPVTIRAFYGSGFHHPHLQGATLGDWPLNVFTADQARAELPVLRAIAAADLHNLVFQRDYRIIPAIMVGAAGKAVGFVR